MATRDVFSEEELQRLRGFPAEINRVELIRHFTLTAADAEFVGKFRGRGNVLGAAVQLCSLPWLGFVPDDVVTVPAVALARLSQRLVIPAGELRGYGGREQTRTDHLGEVARYVGWRPINDPGWKELGEFLFSRAMEHDSPRVLFGLACDYLAAARVIRPGVVHLLTRVATAREQARVETWSRVQHVLDGPCRAELDALLVVDPQIGMSRLRWLGLGPTQASPAAVKTELDKLAYLRRPDAISGAITRRRPNRCGV